MTRDRKKPVPLFYALNYNDVAARADKIVRRSTKNMEKQNGYTPTPEDIQCIGDRMECPYFLRFDICGYEVSWTLNREECV